ncbi:hypothetical protein [Paenibacillus elgii]|uniref:hypothetical protein n=1 Tax=Paenibacillus elgii TaxID=189691 RepID=UPI000492CE0C|nr:hypothetical protein [Paenibacillus elgii]
MNNHGQVGEALYVKYSSNQWFKETGDKYPHGYVITPEEFGEKYGVSVVSIHIDDTTQGRYECVCEFGVEVYE